MKAVTSLLLLLCIFTSLSFAQQAEIKPLVTEKFDKLFLSENFDSSGSYWTTVSNNENLLLVQDGEYILNRKTTLSPYASMANFPNNLNAFRLVTSLKLEKTMNDDGSVGLIFMAQQGGQGGFVFEINKGQQYRLRQIAAGAYHYLTGNQKDGGWIKSSFIKGINIPNLVELRFANKNYDIYINNNLLLSFTEIAYKSGELGFIIGPGSKGKVDFLYLFSNQENIDGKNNLSGKEETSNPENDVLALAESIIKLKTQINKITEENEDLKQIIASYKAGEKDDEAEKLQNQKALKTLEQQVKRSQVSYDSLLKINADLLRYKEMVQGNDGGDLVISLSKNLKTEKLKNEELQKVNQQLRDSLNSIQNSSKQNNKNKPVTPSNTTVKDTGSSPDKGNKGFSLPEN